MTKQESILDISVFFPPGPLTRVSAEVLNAWVKVSPGGDPLWTDTQVFFNGFTAGADLGFFYPSLWGMDRTVCFFLFFNFSYYELDDDAIRKEKLWIFIYKQSSFLILLFDVIYLTLPYITNEYYSLRMQKGHFSLHIT